MSDPRTYGDYTELGQLLKAVEDNPLDAQARVTQIYLFSGSSKDRWFTIRWVSRSLVAHS
jgi:hypothetical protein